MNLGFSSWTDERVARMKELHAAGLSASEIAADLGGITRNAVCGKLDRLGITRGGKLHMARVPRPPRACKEQRIALRKPRPSAPPRDRKNAQQRIQEAEELRAFFASETGPVEGGVSFFDLKKTHCRWPMGDPADLGTFRFCGEQRIEGRPYCAHHHRMSLPAYLREAAE